MKKKIYQSIIAVLALSLVFILFQILNKNEKTPQSQKEYITQDETPKDEKLLNYKVTNIDKKEINTKVQELETQLEKTKQMLLEHNKNTKNSQLTKEEIDRLTSLDLNPNLETATQNTKIQNQEIKKLQKEIEEVKNTIKNMNKSFKE